jgi:hypothetical protein
MAELPYMSQDIVPDYIAARITQPAPAGVRIVPHSTPVIAFGDVRRAWCATLGWNPSKLEFLDSTGRLLNGDARRLETSESLNLTSSSAKREFGKRVFDGCNRYFHRRPYRRWFDVLEKVLKHVGASYYDGSACHLDLVQWATNPVWSGLEASEKERLLISDLPFLRQQLSQENVRLLLLNGAGIMQAYEAHFGVNLERLVSVDGNRLRIFRGFATPKLLVVGWNINLQSSFGVSNNEITMIGGHVMRMVNS